MKNYQVDLASLTAFSTTRHIRCYSIVVSSLLIPSAYAGNIYYSLFAKGKLYLLIDNFGI
ncbi:hypothetical protein QUF54_10485 [Candidatus Marithioploca araucensis]|uniref:Uncharacterized protein n=1 Tax=Candidatus Marithioploca araucensis TaxID=70273 RepID=A0ABT7VW37_9GAMM|nr:hypothetical protein [Candidatus Marithioploca araucensis]